MHQTRASFPGTSKIFDQPIAQNVQYLPFMSHGNNVLHTISCTDQEWCEFTLSWWLCVCISIGLACTCKLKVEN